jgi:glutamate-1-semialdehyde 2,1-aminomutase
MQDSTTLFETASQYLVGGVNSPVRSFRSVGGTPFFTSKAEGARLITTEGKTLIDFVCSWGPAIHGHNHPIIKAAIQEALEKGTSFGTPNPYEIKIAQLICEAIPSIEKIRMCNSGTEATMSAIRLARGYTNRDKIVKFKGCYHGHVDSLLVKAGSGALTFGAPDSAGIPKSFAQETIVLEFNDFEAIEKTFKAHGPTIAGVILEPYPANCGLILPLPGYLKHIRTLCTQYESLLIFDEVMTGFRIAFGGAQAKESIAPDITTLSKIIGGGLPVGAFGGRAEIMAYLAPEGPVYQAGTLSGNPLATAAGIAALKLLKDPKVYSYLNEVGAWLKDSLQAAATAKGIPIQIPQIGSMFCLFFNDQPVHNYEQALRTDSNKFKQLFHYALEHGVYLPPSPYETCFISHAHDKATLEQAIDVVTKGIQLL